MWFPGKYFLKKRKKPDFIIAGFSKCGTTALCHNLNKHPDVFMARENTKNELRFFSKESNWKKGVRWYLNHFSGTCAGEKTPSYIYTKKSMNRIYRLLPDVKLIICIRDPVQRLISWYNHKIIRSKMISSAELPYSLYRQFYQFDMYDPLQTGCYAEVLEKNVLPFFPLSQCYFLIQENLLKNAVSELMGVFNFLELPEYTVDVSYHNVSEKKILPDSNIIEELRDFYRLHNKNLERITGMDLSIWDHQ